MVSIDGDLHPTSLASRHAPVRQLVALYAAKCTTLTAALRALQDDPRCRDMAARLALAAVEGRRAGRHARYARRRPRPSGGSGRFFDAVAASDFLTGRKGGWTKVRYPG